MRYWTRVDTNMDSLLGVVVVEGRHVENYNKLVHFLYQKLEWNDVTNAPMTTFR